MKKCIVLLLLFLAFVNIGLLKSQLYVNFKADTTVICVNTDLSFTDLSTSDTTILSWNWDFGNGEYSTLQNPIIIFDSAGIFTVALEVTDANGSRMRTKQQYIKVRKRPDADFIAGLYFDKFTSDTIAISSYWYEFVNQSMLYDSLLFKYKWDFGFGIFVDSLDTVLYQYPAEGDYIVNFVVDAGLNCTDTATTTITVENKFKAPNIFTPNGDGVNDLFIIETNGLYTYKMTIFNRWGNVVHKSDSKKIIWDGYSPSGVELNQGIYYYHVTSEDVSGFNEYGYVYLFR